MRLHARRDQKARVLAVLATASRPDSVAKPDAASRRDLATRGTCAPRRAHAGFTLTEMLVTVLILTLASTLMATGIPVAIDTYQKTVRTANAQVALSTTLTVLKSELGTAQDLSIEGAGDTSRVRYRSSEGYYASIGNATNTESNHVSNGLDKKYFRDDGKEMYDYGLITDSAITNELRVTCGSIEWDATAKQVILKNVRVVDAANPSNALASVGEYRILARCGS